MIQVRLPTSRIPPECHQMAEFRTLGTLDLRGADDHPVLSILAGSKRVALLAYLAIEGAGGFVRRDSLVGIFWPESDAEHARSSLRSALRILRRGLGDTVITARGDEEIGVATQAFWCDAVAFQQELDEDRLEQALELYRGDLLPGFFLSDTPEFESWLDRTRDRLRQRAVEAAWLLAERHEASGDAAQAERAAARAMEIAADDEEVLRRQIELLDRLGNHSGALHVYNEFARRVAQESGAEPGPRTRALASAIRNRIDAEPSRPTPSVAPEKPQVNRASTPKADPELTAPVASVPAPAPPQSEPVWSPPPAARRVTAHPAIRRPRAYAIAALFLLLVLAGAFLLWDRDPPPPPPDTVAVFPFSVRGADTLSYLGEGMVVLLSTKLQGVVPLQPVDPQAVLGLLAEKSVNRMTPERAGALAQQLGAGHFLLGNILEAGGRLQLTASLYNYLGQLETTAQVEVQDESHIFDLVDRLTAQLVAGQKRQPGGELNRIAAMTTSSLPALKAYLQGEQHFRNQRYELAIDVLQRAIQLDSTFALAAYRLSIAADWAEQWDLSLTALDRAVRYRDELPLHDRLLVEGLLGYNVAATAEADRRYRAALAQQPADVEARYRLGELQFHDYPLIGRWPEESRASFEKVLALDPAHNPARDHLARLAARRGDRKALDQLIPRLLAATPGDSLEWLHLRAFATGDTRLQRQLAQGYSALPDSVLWDMANRVAVDTRDLSGAASIARHLLRPDRAPEARVAAHLMLAHLELARGSPRTAAREIAAAAALDPAAGLAYQALFATPYFLEVPDTQIRTLRDQIAVWPDSGTANPYLSLYTGLAGRNRDYLLGLLDARLRDGAAVARQVAALQASAPPVPHPNRIQRHQLQIAAIQARLAAERGDSVTALALLEQLHKGTPETTFASINYFQRHLRPALLRATGREQDALRWFGAGPWTGGTNEEDPLWDLVHMAPAQFARGEILERNGRTREAAAHYREFVRLWRNADPELQPHVRTAEQRLARLGDGR